MNYLLHVHLLMKKCTWAKWGKSTKNALAFIGVAIFIVLIYWLYDTGATFLIHLL